MGYVDKNLIDGESVVYRTRFHWIVLLRLILVDLILIAGAVLLLIHAYQGGSRISGASIGYDPLVWLAVALLLGAIFTMAWGLMRRNSTEMVVTTRHVLIKTGMVRRNTNEMILSKIESVRVEQSLMGRLLNYGTIVLHGTGGTPDPFPNIDNPLEFRRQVQQQIDRLPAEEHRMTGT